MDSELPPTEERVPLNTAEHVNRRIRQETEARIAYYSRHPDLIEERLAELDEEWDVERVLEANASALAFSGTMLSLATGHRRWLLLPGLVAGFLFQHAMQGWCPPLPALRRLGFRTAQEIEQERNALRALRGDYSLIDRAADKLDAVLRAVGLRQSAAAAAAARETLL